MDPDTLSTIQAGCYSFAAAIGIFSIAKYSFLKRKSDNETYVERTKASMEEDKLNMELSKQKLELMNNPAFRDYQEKRRELAKQLIIENPDLLTCSHTEGELGDTLDMILGKSPLD